MYESKNMFVYLYFILKYYLILILNIEKNFRFIIFIFVCCLYVVEYNF